MELPKQHLPTSLQLSELLTLSELALSNTSQYRIANTSQSETLEMLPEITKSPISGYYLISLDGNVLIYKNG